MAGEGVQGAAVASKLQYSFDRCPVPLRPPVLVDLVESVRAGRPWAPALLEAVGRWPYPCEVVDGDELTYLIAGEAFDWLTLAERLLRVVDEALPGVIPTVEREQLLFRGELPPDVTPAVFREALGVDKFRAHLNFFYGVVVEEALWQAVEAEITKERGVRGLHHTHGVFDGVCEKLYRADLNSLMRRFRKERNEGRSITFSLTDWKAFTYWLFKLRVDRQDSARIASDTRKGLAMLEQIWGLPPHARDGLGMAPRASGL